MSKLINLMGLCVVGVSLNSDVILDLTFFATYLQLVDVHSTSNKLDTGSNWLLIMLIMDSLLSVICGLGEIGLH